MVREDPLFWIILNKKHVRKTKTVSTLYFQYFNYINVTESFSYADFLPGFM